MQEVDCLLTYVILAGWSWEEEGGEDFGCGIVVVRASIGQVNYTVSQENADCWLDRRSAKLIDFMDDIPGRRRVE